MPITRGDARVPLRIARDGSLCGFHSELLPLVKATDPQASLAKAFRSFTALIEADPLQETPSIRALVTAIELKIVSGSLLMPTVLVEEYGGKPVHAVAPANFHITFDQTIEGPRGTQQVHIDAVCYDTSAKARADGNLNVGAEDITRSVKRNSHLHLPQFPAEVNITVKYSDPTTSTHDGY